MDDGASGASVPGGLSGLGDEAPEFDLCGTGWFSRLEVAMRINPINWGAAFL